MSIRLQRPGSNDSSPNGTAVPSPKNQSIWQKATSLRQSLRQSSRSKIGQKAGFDFPVLSNSEKSATLGTPSSIGKSQEPQIRREWKSQRNLARERRSLVSKHGTTDELAAAKRSLHSRSLCMSGDWDVDAGSPNITQNEQAPPPPPPSVNLKEPRSPRKLTKDSGYETSAQCDHDYANSISDWFSQEKALDKIDDGKSWSKDNNVRNSQNTTSGEKRLEWNARNRPLSFSHQEVASEKAKNHRQLRHSYSQREVSRHSHQDSADSLAQLATSVESVDNWPNCPAITKSTPHLAQGRSQRLSTSSTGSLLLSEPDEAGGGNMVTRRFKKGSVYDALASTSGLDFSPVVQLKTYNRRDDTSPIQGSKPSDNIWKKSANSSRSNSSKDNDAVFYKDKPNQESSDTASGTQNPLNSQECKNSFASDSNTNSNEQSKCITAHEKYPSWPVTSSQSTTATQRSHSWTGQTDYPKEKVAYSRPKKANQFKISTNQLQPVLERASDYNSSKSSPENYCPSGRESSAEGYNSSQYQSLSASECSAKQFDFDAFQNPCIPQCYEDKDFRIHSPPERDISSTSSSSVTGPQEESQTNESNGFLSRYEDVLRHQAQYSVPLSSNWSKQRSSDLKGISAGPETPFLDRLRLESNWQVPPPPVPMIPAAAGQQAPPPHPQQLQPPGNDFELSSENGTWMGSMESSSHGRGIPKWQGSYSDLSTLSTQLSNRSSLFDSGHSTMPESGRLSPQSSCDSTAPCLLLEGPTRAQVVARHGCHREIIAHSARVQQPERHGSESVLYYATSSGRGNSESKASSKNLELPVGSGNQLRHDEAMYRSHASVTLSSPHAQSNEVPDCQNKKCPSRQDSRKSSNSFSSEDSFPRSRSYCGDDTSGSSSDISNITCISNYRGTAKSKSLDESSPVCDPVKVTGKDQAFPNYKCGYDQPKSKSMEESPRKFLFPESDKRQRVSDPDLKAIQKQAVMSFYQRMSLAESKKASEQKSGQQSTSEIDPPPPYEATSTSRVNMYPQKLSLMPKKLNKHWENRNPNQISPQTHLPNLKPSDAGLLNHHSKSVPNLVALKGQTLDVPPSHPSYRRTCSVSQWTNANNSCTNLQNQMKRGSPLSKDEIISWDQLPNVLEKKREATEKAAFSAESKDPPEDNGGCSSGMHYFKSHKSPRKVQLKEVHHSNETASVKVMTPDGVTLVQTHEQRRDEKIGAAPLPPHKRRPAPPPPPKQPPKRPPPPPPPVTPPPQVVVVVNGKESENFENKAGEDHKPDPRSSPTIQLPSSASSPQLGVGGYIAPSQVSPSSSCYSGECPSSPDLPLPPPPKSPVAELVTDSDEPLPPPPENSDVHVQPRILDSSSLIYPKNSYMSYRSERKLGRQGFDGKYRRSFHTSASSVDLTTLGSSFQDGKEGFSPNSWEQMHNIRQHGTTVIFHSDCMQPENRLQRSSSQDCVLIEETSSKTTDNISNSKPSESESNQSSSSINTHCSDNQGVSLQSVPYSPASQERNAHQTQNSLSDSHQSGSTKVSSSESPDNVDLNNDSLNENTSSLDNRIMTDDSFVDSDRDTSNFANVDHNQNAVVKNNEMGENNSKNVSGGDLNRINNATQTTDAPIHRPCKTKEEMECEQLSMDFINHCGDIALKNLLVPSPNHKTISDYMDGLLNLELERGGFPIQKNHGASQVATNTINNENKQKDEKWLNNEKCNTIFNSKMRLSQCMEVNENQPTDDEIELNKKKDELVQCIEKKVNTLRSEQSSIREEMNQNELLGQEIASRLQKLAKPNELEKYTLHVEEMEKIVNLLLSLSARLARAENILKNMPKEGSSEEKKILEAKREKLREQHEDARRLKENIDRRSNHVSTFLHKYLTDDEYADYDRFMKLKTKLIMDIRELDEKINLGEEQLAALSVVAHLWKSANS